jgi:acyl-CoA thioesterase-2
VPAPDAVAPVGGPLAQLAEGEVRVVGGVDLWSADAPPGPPQLDAWVRFGDVPDDPASRAALLVSFTGQLSIAAALRPHPGVGQDQAHVSLSTAVNAIALSLHADVRPDRWMLFHHRSTFAGAGMTHSSCRVHDVDGDLLASFSVDGMVRAMQPAPADGQRVL